ncbi:MAG: LPXTG cell wall anchor domain-containing protein [Oscillospiraceae bacterium]|jgi:LPXTG-motif cell wall-anchored protein|nr:LPXTG cell wall anchor domain-containing protein [Oscillospiraceae bacterium]
MKRVLSLACVLALALSLLVVVPAASAAETALNLGSALTISDPGNYIGAMIDASIFTVGSAYKLEFNVTSAGTTAFRVRYSENFMENGPFYDGDFVSADPAKDRGNLDAYQIPAFFTNGPIADGDTVTLTVYFKHGDLQSQGINYVGLFGGSGGSDYIVNSVKVTAIESVPDVPPLPGGTDPSTPPTTPPVDPSTPPVDPSVPPTTGPGAPTGDNGFVFVALGLLALTGLGVVVLVRKSKA